MIFGLFGKNTATDAVYGVYRSIVAQSRQERFYAELGVPDTVTGRFDMISLHLSLLFRRLRSGKPDAKVFSQAVFDLFFKDMDRSLREMGVGDLGVPKRIQKMGNVFYGLMSNINEAIDRGDHAGVAEALRRNVYGDAIDVPAEALADYLFAEARHLETQSIETILKGRIDMGVVA